MSRIDDVIAEHCPDGVEFKALEDLGVLYNGLTGKSKADFSAGNARFVTYMNVFKNHAADIAPDSMVRVAEGERQNRVRYGDVLFTASSESADEVGMASGVTVEPSVPLYLNSFCFGFRPHDVREINPEFAKHLFRSGEVRRQIIKTANGVTRINISKERFRGIKIPIPPPAVQQEVAGILDKMETLKDELEAELEAELEYRSRQYVHYRDSLLTPGESAGSAKLSDLFHMRSGKFIAASEISDAPDANHPFPCFGGGGLRGYVAQASHEGGRVLIGRQGALCGNVKRTYSKFYATEHAVVVTAKPGVDICWAFHMLTAMDLNQYASKSAQPGLAVGTIAALSVPVPPLAAQQRAGAILDKFDALVNNLSAGLPAEIAARRQQYLYYRDRSLTFEEAARD